ESEAGIGSEFVILLDHGVANQSGDLGDYTMELPMDDDWEEVEWDGDIEEDQATSENATIVVVDDNSDILTYLNSFLSRRYEVLLFGKSSEAITAIRNQKIDLVVSDVMMADPDGFEFCRIIKGDPDLNHIPVILLTARAGEESRLEGLELGADDYISKPFSASELLIRVENLIELRRLLREKFSEEIRVKGKKVDVSSEDARFLQQVQSVIEKHMEDGNFSVDWLADEVNLSSRQLQRKLRAITHLSAGGYIRLLRLERASQLLAQHWGNVSEVSYKVGFQDSKYFSRLFKQTFGETPSEFANKK
ncbi:MAG TPA: response regulator, partial [Balneolaceae bacterium]|nr:response regulator [Balneolaceae bacterium]